MLGVGVAAALTVAPAVVITLGLGWQPWPSTMGEPAAVVNARAWGYGDEAEAVVAEGLLKLLTLLVVVPAIVVNAGGGGGCHGC